MFPVSQRLLERIITQFLLRPSDDLSINLSSNKEEDALDEQQEGSIEGLGSQATGARWIRLSLG
jgi:hypothetical protein